MFLLSQALMAKDVNLCRVVLRAMFLDKSLLLSNNVEVVAGNQ